MKVTKQFPPLTSDQLEKAQENAQDLAEIAQWIAQFVLTSKDGGDAWCAIRNNDGAKEWSTRMKSTLDKIGLLPTVYKNA